NKDIVEDPHLAARGFMVEWDQPAVGVRKYPGFPIHFSNLPPVPMRPCPDLGQDNHYVLAEVLGDDAESIAQLEAGGVINTTPSFWRPPAALAPPGKCARRVPRRRAAAAHSRPPAALAPLGQCRQRVPGRRIAAARIPDRLLLDGGGQVSPLGGGHAGHVR